MCPMHASLKTPPKNPLGNKGRREECIARASRIALVVSLKTLHDKNPVGKNSSREKGTTIDALVWSSGPTCDLQDHNTWPMIFRAGLPLNPTNL
jgi:hypothetical protein